MDTNTYRHWYDEEVRALLKIWCDSKTQRLLQRRCRNKDVYGMISGKLRTLGYQRDWTQCRVKIKNLKYEYRAAKDGTLRGGPSQMARCMRFFNDIDKVLSGDQTNGGSIADDVCGEDPLPLPPMATVPPEDQPLVQVKKEAAELPEVEIIDDGAAMEPGQGTEAEESRGGGELSDPEFAEETEGDSVSSMTNFLVMTLAPSVTDAGVVSTPAHSELVRRRLVPGLSDPQTGPISARATTVCQHTDDFQAVPGPSQSLDTVQAQRSTDDGPSPKLPTGPSDGAVPSPQGGAANSGCNTFCDVGANKKRPRSAGLCHTLERITAMFLQHEKLSEEKYYRWEAHQRQLERLHELRLVSTIIQGFQSIANPSAAATTNMVSSAVLPDTDAE